MSGPTAVGARRVDRRPVLLLVDNRVSDFTQYVLNRRDVSVVLLRFDEFADTVPHWPPWGRLPRSWRDETRHVPSFDVSAKRSLEDEAQRYRRWVSASPVVPTWFCNPEEHVQEIGHRFAALVGLPHLDGEQVAWVRDKVAMKQRFTQLGIPTAAHRAVDQPVESVLSFATEHGWPVVLKPVDSFATIDTHLVRDADQLRRLAPGLPDRRWMVEEFVPGREYQVCALVAGSRVLDVYLSLNPHPLLQTLSGAMNADVTVGRGCGEYAIQPAVTRLVQRVVAGMRIARGYVHLEVFLRDDGSLCLSEVAARLAGCGIPANHGLAYGFDVFGATLDTYLGRVPRLSYRDDRCAGDLLLPTRAGRVVSVTSPERLAGLPGVVSVRVEVKPGDVLHHARASNARSGQVQVVGSTVEQVLRRMEAVLEVFEVTVEPASQEKKAGSSLRAREQVAK